MTTILRHRTNPLRVDHRRNAWDAMALRLARAGLSINAIASQTNLSPHQVSYRLRTIGVSVRDYRAGVTEESQRLIARVKRSIAASRQLRQSINDHRTR